MTEKTPGGRYARRASAGAAMVPGRDDRGVELCDELRGVLRVAAMEPGRDEREDGNTGGTGTLDVYTPRWSPVETTAKIRQGRRVHLRTGGLAAMEPDRVNREQRRNAFRCRRQSCCRDGVRLL